MKLSTLQENLTPALTHVSRFVSAKSSLPVLSNILLSTDQGRLKLSATNLEIGINYWLGAKIETEGSITIPAREITEFVSYLQPGKIDLSLDSSNLLTISSPKAESSFTTLAATDYPSLPSLDPKTSFKLDYSLLQSAVSQVAFSAAADDTRPVLTGILCYFSPEAISFVATDGFRLSLKTVKPSTPLTLAEGQESLSLLIPARSLTEITKLSKNAASLTLGPASGGTQFVFALENLELVSRLIEGDYPDYRKIIPSDFTTTVSLNRQEFSQAVKIASVFARESANVVKMAVKSSSLQLSANAPQIGRNQATVDAKVDGDPLEIAFNYKFLSDFLNICQGEEVIIRLNQNLTPGLFSDPSDPSFTHIIMPVRIQD